jgi:site-specific DNA recombinase
MTHNTTPETKQTAVAYIRVSTDEQANGPAAQLDVIEAWCAARGVALVAVFEDLGISGGAPLDKRPGLLAALGEVAEVKAALLIVAKRDRMARDVMIAAMAERMAERSGARVVSAAGEGTEDEGPAGQLMRTMVDAFAAYERALIGERTRAALAAKRARGERTGHLPYGMQVAADGRTLQPCPAEQEVIAAVHEYRAAGLTLAAIAARLAERGLWTRNGRGWSAKTVRDVARKELAA